MSSIGSRNRLKVPVNHRKPVVPGHRDINDPEIAEQLQDRVDEITKVMQAVPSDRLPELVAEPQYSAGLIHTYILTTAGQDIV